MMTRTHNHNDASSTKTFKTCDNAAPWSELNHDVLYSVMMQLRAIDFLSFSGICKSWRSFALSKKNKFMASRPPMSISIFYRIFKEDSYCYLEDFEGRKFKSNIPHSFGRECVGLTCGYLVLFGRKTRDFWLVNPITRHEFHFPNFNEFDAWLIPSFKAILVFSPSISGWVFVVLNKFTHEIWFSREGKGAWNRVSSTFLIIDLCFFRGKIYTINKDSQVCEMRLNPEPKLTLLETKNLWKPHYFLPQFVSSCENLYVMNDHRLLYSFNVHELNVGEMKWVKPENSMGEYVFFVSTLKNDVAVKPESWADLWSQYQKYVLLPDESRKYRLFAASMWYFPHECMNVNLIDE